MLQQFILQAIDFQKLNCAFVVKNLQTGECASYNSEARVASASLIKLAVMAESIRQVKEGKLNLKQRLVVREEDKVDFSILTLLATGNSYTLRDLLTLTIVQSDNTAANILIDLTGMTEINKFCNDLGLKDTVLRRKMMDGEARKAGRENYTTAADMARFLELLYQGKLLDPESCSLMIEIMKKQLDNTMIRLYIPDDTVVAHKTGELEGISHEAGIVYHDKADFIIVMLVWDALSGNDARQTIGRAAKTVYDYFITEGN
ncbi:MAG TPA: serine hydrolase [Firmicutes bacterium]|nr:serine hydrolase [Bacillota bacterium]